MSFSRRSFLLTGGVALGATSTGTLALAIGDRTRSRIVNVRNFGALGDGRADDRVPIQRAIDSLAHSGGGTVRLPPGIFSVGRSEDGPFAIQLRSNIKLIGDGTKSVIKLADHAADRAGSHTLYIDRAWNVGVYDLIVDGNRPLQRNSGHCLKSDGVDGLILENLVVRNAYSYGLGFQNGVNRRIRIANVIVQDTGADGIDFKNKVNGNEEIDLRDVTVRRWGLRENLRIQAGIDCRGPVRLRNIRVSEPGSHDSIGVRMRQGERREVNGLGAHNSSLAGFDIRMGRGSGCVGVDVVSRAVSLSNGSISGGFRGLAVHDSGFRGDRIRVANCLEAGILFDALGSGLDADGAILSNSAVIGCGGDGISVESDNVQLLNCRSTGARRHGLIIRSSAESVRVVGGDYSHNRAGSVANHGRNTRLAVSIS